MKTILTISAGSLGIIHHEKELSLELLQLFMFPGGIQETFATLLHKTKQKQGKLGSSQHSVYSTVSMSNIHFCYNHKKSKIFDYSACLFGLSHLLKKRKLGNHPSTLCHKKSEIGC